MIPDTQRDTRSGTQSCTEPDTESHTLDQRMRRTEHLQEGLAALPEPWCLDGRHLDDTPQLVHHQGGQCLTAHILLR